MSYLSTPLELNLYRVEILHKVNLEDIDPLDRGYNDDVFVTPDFLPSTRVGRYETVPTLDSFVQLKQGDPYRIKVYNYTWKKVLVKVFINDHEMGMIILEPRCESIFNWKLRFNPEGRNHHSDLIEIRFEPEKSSDLTYALLANGEPAIPRTLVLDPTKVNVFYVRLIEKPLVENYESIVSYRGLCV